MVNRAGDGPSTVATAGQFVKGVVVGSDSKNPDAASVAGDVVGSFVPGLGEIKAVQDIYAGIKDKDPITLVGGIVGLIPVVGGLGKAGAKAAKGSAKVAKGAKGTAKVAKGVQTGAKLERAGLQGFKISAMQLGETALKSTRATLKTKRGKKAAMGAASLAIHSLVEKLTGMASRGEAPEVESRRHTSFIDARKTVEDKIGKPQTSWADLYYEDEEGKKTIVGRHDNGEKGFRIIRPPEDGDSDFVQLMWWDQGGDRFGMEEAQASKSEIDAIEAAYTNRKKSFRSTRRSA